MTAHQSELPPIGTNIRRYREELDISLNELAERSHVSKGYISALENGTSNRRPSGETLYALAEVLGVTMSELMGRRLLTDGTGDEVSPSLRDFADEAGLPQRDVQMLAAIEFRGEQPKSKERWQYIYNAIRTSSDLDKRK